MNPFAWLAWLFGGFSRGGKSSPGGEASAAAIYARVVGFLGPQHAAMIRVSGLRRPYDFCAFRMAKIIVNPATGNTVRQTVIFAGPDEAGASFRIYPLMTEYYDLASREAQTYARLYHRTRFMADLPQGAGAARLDADDFLFATVPQGLGLVPGLCLPDAIEYLRRTQHGQDRRILWIERKGQAHAAAVWREEAGWFAWANDVRLRAVKHFADPAALARELGYPSFDTAFFLEPL